MEQTMIRDLTTGSVGKELLRFSFPFMLSNALQTIYNLVDMVIVGQFVGSVGLSAVSIGGQLMWLMCCLAIGYTSGGQIFISQLVGAGDHAGVRRTIGTIFTTMAGFSLVIATLGIVFCDPLLALLNTPPEALDQARDYVLICAAGMFFVIAISALLNVILDLIFVGPLGMASAGAALATILAQAVSFIISIIYLYRRKESFGFDFRLRSFLPDGKTFAALSRLGLPLTVQSTAINVSMLYVSAGVNSYGLVYSSTFGIGGKLQSVMFIITNSISTASASMFGQNLGAGKHDRVKKIFWFGNLYCMILFLVVTVFCLTIPVPVFRLFTKDPDVLAQAAHYMVVQVVMFSGFASMTAGIALINGIGNGSLSLITALLDGVVVRIGLCMLLAGPLGWGVWGYFWGNALAGYVSTLIGWLYYLTGAWKRRKLMIE